MCSVPWRPASECGTSGMTLANAWSQSSREDAKDAVYQLRCSTITIDTGNDGSGVASSLLRILGPNG